MIKVTVGNNLSRKSVIVEETATLREVLEDNEINYTTGMTALDGATLKAGDLDKTFADFGISEKCYLLNVVKADNAAEITVLGEAAVLTSSMKLEDIQMLKKYNPKVLSVFDSETKEESFRVSVSAGGAGMANKYGISFSPTANANGYAQVTINLPEDHGDVMDYLEDHFGEALLYLNDIEANADEAIAATKDHRRTVRNQIRIL